MKLVPVQENPPSSADGGRALYTLAFVAFAVLTGSKADSGLSFLLPTNPAVFIVQSKKGIQGGAYSVRCRM